jgi:hypothetical protein
MTFCTRDRIQGDLETYLSVNDQTRLKNGKIAALYKNIVTYS